MPEKYKFDITYVYGNGRKIKLESKKSTGERVFLWISLFS